MRTRLLHPGFFTDIALLSLPPLTRILFQGLWLMADREGKLADKPMEIRLHVLPGDNCDVNAMLEDLSNIGRIVRYEIGGRRFIKISRFADYQKPHKKEKQSTIPDPPCIETNPGSETQPIQGGLDLTLDPVGGGGDRAVSVSVSVSELATETKDRSSGSSRAFTDQLCADYQEIRGEPYLFAGGRDGTAISKLLASFSQETIRQRWRRGLQSSGWSQVNNLGQLFTKWQDLAAPGTLTDPHGRAAVRSSPSLPTYDGTEDPYATKPKGGARG